VILPEDVTQLRRPFAKFVDWRQCATVMQRERRWLLCQVDGWG